MTTTSSSLLYDRLYEARQNYDTKAPSIPVPESPSTPLWGDMPPSLNSLLGHLHPGEQVIG